MTMKRSIFALGIAGMLAFAAFAFLGDSAANACCAGGVPGPTENEMTITNAGSPITVPGGSLVYNINVATANVDYSGFAWETAANDIPVTFTAFSHAGAIAAGYSTCTAPATSFPFGPGVLEIYGGGAGCIDVAGTHTPNFTGIVATVTAMCNAPAITAVAMLGLDSDPLFGTTTLDATGAVIPTVLNSQIANPSFPAFGPPTIAAAPFLCLTPVDLSIVKNAQANANVGDAGVYTITVTNPTAGPELGTVTDAMPAGVTATAVAPAPCVITGGGTGISCVDIPLPPGPTVVTVNVTFDSCGIKNNTATIALNPGIVQIGPSTFVPTRTDPDPSNNSSMASTDVDCPNISLVKSVNPAIGTAGVTVFNYTTIVCNDGGVIPPGSSANGVTVTDPDKGPGVIGPLVLLGGQCQPINDGIVYAAAGVYCNESSATSTDAGNPTSNTVCVEVVPNFPDFNGMRKDCDTSAPDTTTTCNIWLTYDAQKNPVGTITIGEQLNVQPDIDTCNDDDDGDGFPCAGVAGSPLLPFQVPQDLCGLETGTKDGIDYWTENYIPHQTSVDCDGGEVGEGLGAVEFQIKYDHKLFQQPVVDCDGAQSLLDDTGRVVQTQVSVITENWTLFGCVTKGEKVGAIDESDVTDGCTDGVNSDPLDDSVVDDGCPTPGVLDPAGIVATVTLTVQDDLFQRIRPTKDNGVVTTLLDENCEAADIFGMPWPGHTQGGLLPECGDVTLTIRMLEGDLDLDCDVDVSDDQQAAYRYGSFFGNLLYNKFYDLEPNIAPDFDIDIKDLQTVFGRNGSTCANPIPLQTPNSQTPAPPDP